MKKILLISTGGTIACKQSAKGLKPDLSAEQLLSYVQEIQHLCQLETLSLMSIDSSNMTPQLMAKIAKAIYESYHHYDGFIVTHGTDTLAYSAAALTYMLPKIAKPLVLTGSQLTLENPHSDAPTNIADAIRFSLEGLPGVFVVFNGKIINGPRAKKVKTRSLDAFSSNNYPLVADIKQGQITYNNDLNLNEDAAQFKNPQQMFSLKDKIDERVVLLKLTPGINPERLLCLKQTYRGVIIESFGIGGVPDALLETLEELIKADVAVVITTQCYEEGVDLEVYEVGQNLSALAIINGGDMSSEALTMKLMWALGQYESSAQIKAFIETPIQGDRSV
jgi:L-asparaginase